MTGRIPDPLVGLLPDQNQTPVDFIDTETLGEFLEMTWTAFVDPTGHLEPLTDAPVPGPGVLAELRIVGPSPVHVTLHIDPEGALSVARGMRKEAVDATIPDSDINDALGELVNVLGGNIKSLLPEGSALSLPVVHRGTAPTPVEGNDVGAIHAWGSFVLTTTITTSMPPLSRPPHLIGK